MVGKTLGHYEILEPLGKGGMGEVYRARDTTLKRDVAIKVLSEEFATDADRLARLKREAHLLASLNHPNIATIHSLEQDEATRFLVLELVEGRSLGQQLVSGPLGRDEALSVCLQIADALQAAHDAGIVHRDLKPANVLVTPDGRAKVLDFGIAKTLEEPSVAKTAADTGLTAAGALLGTVPYMSPEQIRGQPADERSDIWAFGCLLYETLTGTLPFARETAGDTLAAIVAEKPNWEPVPDSPPSLRSLLGRLFEKDPARRPQAAREVAAAITQCQAELTGPVTVTGELAVLSRTARRPYVAIPLVAGVALVGFMG